MQLIPLFPLEIVVFPYESLNLHIFEPRYRELIQDCQNEQLHFGIPYFKESQPLKYGTIVELIVVANTYDDGRLDIKTKGLRPFEIKRYVKKFPGKSYPGGYIEELHWEDDPDEGLRIEIRNRVNELYNFMNIKERSDRLESMFTTFEIAHKVGLSKSQEYEFLKIITEVDRQKYLLDHLDKMIPMVKEAEEMRRKIQLNGHFKNLKPPSM